MSKQNPAVIVDGVSGEVDPTPKLNLSNYENVRHEMARVYRDMRSQKIDLQDGSRLIYALTSICKVLEAENSINDRRPSQQTFQLIVEKSEREVDDKLRIL